jgi:hypothetical protein
MSADDAVARVTIAAGVLFALLALAATASSFPVPPGNDTGGPGLFPLAFPAAALAGGLLGGGLLRYTARTDSRLVGLALKFALATGVIAGSVAYGVVVTPSYFEASVVRSWLGATLLLTVLVVAVQEGIYELST